MVKGVVVRNSKNIKVDGLTVKSDDPTSIGVEADGVENLETNDINMIHQNSKDNKKNRFFLLILGWKSVLFVVGVIGLVSALITIDGVWDLF